MIKVILIFSVLTVFASETTCRRLLELPTHGPNGIKTSGPSLGRSPRDTSGKSPNPIVLPTHQRPHKVGTIKPPNNVVPPSPRVPRAASPQVPSSSTARIPLVSSLAQTPKKEFPIFDAQGNPSGQRRTSRDTKEGKALENSSAKLIQKEKPDTELKAPRTLTKDKIPSVHSTPTQPIKTPSKDISKASVQRATRETKEGQDLLKKESKTKHSHVEIPPLVKDGKTRVSRSVVKEPTKPVPPKHTKPKTLPRGPNKAIARTQRDINDEEFALNLEASELDTHTRVARGVIKEPTKPVPPKQTSKLLSVYKTKSHTAETNKAESRKTRDTNLKPTVTSLKPKDGAVPSKPKIIHRGPHKAIARTQRDINEEESTFDFEASELDAHTRVARGVVKEPTKPILPKHTGNIHPVDKTKSHTVGTNKAQSRMTRDTHFKPTVTSSKPSVGAVPSKPKKLQSGPYKAIARTQRDIKEDEFTLDFEASELDAHTRVARGVVKEPTKPILPKHTGNIHPVDKTKSHTVGTNKAQSRTTRDTHFKPTVTSSKPSVGAVPSKPKKLQSGPYKAIARTQRDIKEDEFTLDFEASELDAHTRVARGVVKEPTKPILPKHTGKIHPVDQTKTHTVATNKAQSRTTRDTKLKSASTSLNPRATNTGFKPLPTGFNKKITRTQRDINEEEFTLDFESSELDAHTRIARGVVKEPTKAILPKHTGKIHPVDKTKSHTVATNKAQSRTSRTTKLKPVNSLNPHPTGIRLPVPIGHNKNNARTQRDINEEELAMVPQARATREVAAQEPLLLTKREIGVGPIKEIERHTRDVVKHGSPNKGVLIPTHKGQPGKTPKNTHVGPQIGRVTRDIKGEDLEMEPGNARWRRALHQPLKPVLPTPSKPRGKITILPIRKE